MELSKKIIQKRTGVQEFLKTLRGVRDETHTQRERERETESAASAKNKVDYFSYYFTNYKFTTRLLRIPFRECSTVDLGPPLASQPVVEHRACDSRSISLLLTRDLSPA